MSAYVVGPVLVAALLHAGWNAIAKHIPSQLAASSLIGGVYVIVGCVGVFILPHPAAVSWPFLAVSACLQTGYLLLLTASYRHGEFSQLCPLARGLAIVQVAIVSAVVLGERLSALQMVGVGVIAGALLVLAFLRSRPTGRNRRGVGLAVLTGVCIAGYTIIDGQGVRQSGAPLGYVAALFLLQGVALPLTCTWLAPDRQQLSRAAATLATRRSGRPDVTGRVRDRGLGQCVTPMALVCALRETSVLLAGVLGWVAFGERVSPVRTLLTIAAVGGVVALQLG
jgi:uncharacterized membrane protein